MEMDKDIYSSKKLIAFKCLKTGLSCINSHSVEQKNGLLQVEDIFTIGKHKNKQKF